MNKKLKENISSLIKLDLDAAAAYRQAIDRIDHPEVTKHLHEFLKDHDRHVASLTDYLRSKGETPPERSKDFKGFLIEGFTSLRSMTGEKSALKAMQTNEKLTNKKYKQAFENWDLDVETRGIIAENYEDEKRHLAYIEEAIETKIWEKAHH